MMNLRPHARRATRPEIIDEIKLNIDRLLEAGEAGELGFAVVLEATGFASVRTDDTNDLLRRAVSALLEVIDDRRLRNVRAEARIQVRNLARCAA